MDTEGAIRLLLVVLVVTSAYLLLRIGIRIGARRAVNDIVRGFRQEVPEKKGDDNLAQAVKVGGWYPLIGRMSSVKDAATEMEIERVGRLLARIGFNAGADMERGL